MFFFTFFLQYIFSTYLIYNNYEVLGKQMPIKQEVLFGYAVPALSFLFLGMLLFNKDVDIQEAFKNINPRKAIRLGYLLLAISYGFDLAVFSGLSILSSIASFTYYLKYLAGFCFLFSGSITGYLICGLVYSQLLLTVLSSGVFIDLIVWGNYLLYFIALKFRLSFFSRAALFLSAIPLLFVIQSVKNEYRSVVWKNKQEGSLGLFTELAQKQNEKKPDESFKESDGVISTVGRLNQGWHLGLTLRRVPLKEPFSNGEEMFSDIASSILPRFLFPDKKVIHTREKFRKYTGHKLGPSTSMTIGILGDFYINFGRVGSYIGLFIFGALVARLVYFFNRKFIIDSDPVNIIWLPFIFSYLVRADNDFYVFFNSMLKGFVIFFAVNYLRYQFIEPRVSTKPVVGISKSK